MVKLQTLIDKFGSINKGSLITLYDLQALANPSGNFLGTWEYDPNDISNTGYLPGNITNMPSGTKRNDFAHVRQGDGYGTAASTGTHSTPENWVILNIDASGNIDWTFDVALGTDLTNKLDKAIPPIVATPPTDGNIAKWDAGGTKLVDGGTIPSFPTTYNTLYGLSIGNFTTTDPNTQGIPVVSFENRGNSSSIELRAFLRNAGAVSTLVPYNTGASGPGSLIGEILQNMRNNLRYLLERFNTATAAALKADVLSTARSVDSNVDDSNLIETTPTFDGSASVELVNTINLSAVTPDNQDDLPASAWKNSIKNLFQLIFNKLAGLETVAGNWSSQVSSPSTLEGGAYWRKCGHVVSAFLYCRKLNNGSSYTIQPGSQVVCGTCNLPTPSQYIGGFGTIVEGHVIQNGWAAQALPTDGTDLVIGVNPANNQVYIRNNGPNAFALALPSSGGGLRLGTLVTYITED